MFTNIVNSGVREKISNRFKINLYLLKSNNFKMEKISFYILANEELSVVSDRTAQILESDLSHDSFISLVLGPLKANISKFSEAISKVTNKEYTLKVGKADNTRDGSFIGYRDYCKAFTNSPDKKMRAAAQRLVKLIKQAGWTLYKDGDTVESAKMNSLITKLKSEEYSKDIDTINSRTWFDNLVKDQLNFEAVVQEKADHEAGKEVPLILETKSELKRLLPPVLDYIELRAELSGDGYAGAMNKLDEIISEIMTIARARHTRKDNDSQEN